MSKQGLGMSAREGRTEKYNKLARKALSGAIPNYNLYHASIAATHMDIPGRTGLIVGCNRGEDCRPFIEFGAEKLVGLDVMDEIGVNFINDRVTYVRESAEKMSFDSGSFDFIFCFATMEHVPDIEKAFAEMERVLRTGGVVYSVASPLWCTRQGPHWGEAFDSYPWIHLRRAKSDIIDYVAEKHASDPKCAFPDQSRIEYLLDPANINRRRSRDYVNACMALDRLQLIRNDIDFENPADVDRAAVRECLQLGYDAFDLFGLTHTLVARKL